jgi:sugar phosphate isomerase/epimerase
VSAPLALQLYSVRQMLSRDFAGVIRRIAEIGYAGVEPIFVLPGTTLQAAGQLFHELGLAVPSAHMPLPVGTDKQAVIDAMGTLGCPRLISGKGPESFASLDAIRQACDLFNKAQVAAAEQGWQFGIHNHWWEFEKVEGRPVYQVMLERLDPRIFFEIDTYWVQTAGYDPAKVVREFASRAPLLHIKDGPAVRGRPHTAVGDGVIDVPAIIEASGPTAEWLVVELDNCAGDMMTAVERSYHYLVRGGWAHGRAC